MSDETKVDDRLTGRIERLRADGFTTIGPTPAEDTSDRQAGTASGGWSFALVGPVQRGERLTWSGHGPTENDAVKTAFERFDNDDRVADGTVHEREADETDGSDR